MNLFTILFIFPMNMTFIIYHLCYYHWYYFRMYYFQIRFLLLFIKQLLLSFWYYFQWNLQIYQLCVFHQVNQLIHHIYILLLLDILLFKHFYKFISLMYSRLRQLLYRYELEFMYHFLQMYIYLNEYKHKLSYYNFMLWLCNDHKWD